MVPYNLKMYKNNRPGRNAQGQVDMITDYIKKKHRHKRLLKPPHGVDNRRRVR